MRVLESILYNNLNASLQRHHNPEITDIKEHICGGPKKIEESRIQRSFCSSKRSS